MNINAGGESGKREPRQHIESAFHPMPGPPRPLSRITVGEPSPLLEWLSVRPPTSTGRAMRAEEPDLRSLEPELRVQMRWTTKAWSNRSKCGI